MKLPAIGRRELLRALGAAGLVAPFLGLSRPARGAEPPKRLILFHSANGLEPLRLTPPSFTKQLADLLVLDGVDWPGNYAVPNDNAHIAGTNASLTANIGGNGIAKGPSIDRFLIDRLKPTSPFDSVDLGVHWDVKIANPGEGHPINFSMSGAGIGVESSPRKAFDRLFSTSVMGGGADAMAAAARLRARKQSILDHISGELTALQPKLTAEERVRIDGHLTSLRAIEKRLTDPAMPMPTSPTINTKAVDDSVTMAGAAPDFPATGVLQMDILTLAMAMGLSNFATLRWGHSVNEMTYPWTGTNRGAHAELAHGGGGAMPDFRKVLYWYADQYLALVNRLKAVSDAGGGTLLDNSLVLWNSDMCDGNHSARNGLMVLAGSLGGAVRTGRIVPAKGASLNGIYADVCAAMGAPTDAFGSAGVPNGPLGILG